MKKTDIAAVILIAAFSVLIAYFVAKAIIGDPAQESVQVNTATRITSALSNPNKDVFNSDSINPTVEVVIGNGSTSNDSTDTGNTNNQGSTNNDQSTNNGTNSGAPTE
ncbi:hypothetical protein FWF48_00545 [Candidatus Saccharibacteria bacterium]|nr:hypothetical protein [Candidatus Saccharibacteria bacterium]